jgi:hypothetical protein
VKDAAQMLKAASLAYQFVPNSYTYELMNATVRFSLNELTAARATALIEPEWLEGDDD